MKTEVTYRGGSGAQGSMEVVGDCGECWRGWIVQSIYWTDVPTLVPCYCCNGTGREKKD